MLKAALIGCGNISRTHLKVISENENIQLTAVCDIQRDRADKTASEYGCEKFYSIDNLLKNGDFDVLHICTPHYLHSPMAVQALNAGKNVLCEKPMCITLNEADAIERAVKNSGKHYGVCFQNRYNPASRMMRQVLEGGSLGKILGGRAAVYWDRDENYYLADAWRGKITTEGGGVLINQSIHTLDLLLWMIGNPVADVKSSISTKRLASYIQVEDTADLLLQFEDGQRAVFFATICNVGNDPIELNIYCEKGKITLGEKLIIHSEEGEEVYDTDKLKGEKGYWGNGHSALIADFYDCIENDKEFQIGFDEAKKTVEVLNKVYN